MTQSPFRPGQLEVICGPMWSSKSAELIVKLDKFNQTDYIYQAFKPDEDKRDGPFIVTRRGNLRIPAPFIAASDPSTLFAQLREETKVLAFDESQFFGPAYIKAFEDLRREGLYLIAAGLDLDFMGEGMGIMPELAARANDVMKLVAICEHTYGNERKCQAEATHSIKLINGEPAPYVNIKKTQVGDKGTYSPRCIEHHIVPGRPTSR